MFISEQNVHSLFHAKCLFQHISLNNLKRKAGVDLLWNGPVDLLVRSQAAVVLISQ